MSCGAFVGQFDVAVAPDGAVVFPEDWRTLWGSSKEVCLCLDPDEKCLVVFHESEARSDTDLKFVRVPISADWTLKLPRESLNAAGIVDSAIATGCIRYIRLWSPEWLAEQEKMTVSDPAA